MGKLAKIYKPVSSLRIRQLAERSLLNLLRGLLTSLCLIRNDDYLPLLSSGGLKPVRWIALLMLMMVSLNTSAQDIPLFSQKLTNSFIYNPAMAGHTHGSLTYAYRKNFGGVTGAAENNFISFHTPFADHRFGVGANLFMEKVNFVQNTFASAAFAYHINFGSYNTLSFGVSGEYNNIGFNLGDINFEEGQNDPLLGENQSNMDFSFGVNYQHRYFKVGIAANRLSTAFLIDDPEEQGQPEGGRFLSEFYSGYAAGLIPLRGGQDILEPTFTYRNFSESSDPIWDAGLFYTYNNLVVAGASYRAGDILSLTAALKISNKLLLGYSYEMVNNNLGSDLGATNEITLRFDFNDKTYQDRFRADYKNSLAFRRKTLSSASKRSRVGAKSPRAFKKKQKRRLRNRKSPNQRYNNLKKLPKSERRKFNNKKQRRKNYRKRKQKRYRKNKGGFFSWLFGG